MAGKHEEYPIIDISAEILDEIEQMGSKSKFWYKDSSTNEEYLFKSIHTQDGNGKDIIRKGEDWAEKVGCELAAKLDIPHAHYELATFKNERGVISKKFTLPGDNMYFGNQLIEHIVNTLNITLERGQRSQKIERVYVALDSLVDDPPQGWEPTENIRSSYDVFIGYLMLDTLISNQDRHNENWAMIANGKNSYLAPTFDHGASLGRNESEKTMIAKLVTNDQGQQIPTYVSKSKSFFYDGNKRLKTLDAFLMAGYLSKKAMIEWFDKLDSLSIREIVSIVFRVPSTVMSDVEKEFCTSIIAANRARILLHKNLFKEN